MLTTERLAQIGLSDAATRHASISGGFFYGAVNAARLIAKIDDVEFVL